MSVNYGPKRTEQPFNEVVFDEIVEDRIVVGESDSSGSIGAFRRTGPGGGAGTDMSTLIVVLTVNANFSQTQEAIDANAVFNSADTTGTSLYAIRVEADNIGPGTVNHAIGLKVNPSQNSGGGIVNLTFGVYIADPTTNFVSAQGGASVHMESSVGYATPGRTGVSWGLGANTTFRLYNTGASEMTFGMPVGADLNVQGSVQANATSAGAGTMPAFLAQVAYSGAGTLGNAMGLKVLPMTSTGGGTVTNNWGLYIVDPTTTLASGAGSSLHMEASGGFAHPGFTGITWGALAVPTFRLYQTSGTEMTFGLPANGRINFQGGVQVSADPGAGTAGRSTLTNATGIGNGAATNLQAPAIGTGSGPASLTVANWVKEYDGATLSWRPLFR